MGVGLEEFDVGICGNGFGDHAGGGVDADEAAAMAGAAEAAGKIAGAGADIEEGFVAGEVQGFVDRGFEWGADGKEAVGFDADAEVFFGFVLLSEKGVGHNT